MDNTFNFNLLSLNVRGLKSDALKRRSLFHWFKNHNESNSIIFLQETHSTKECVIDWRTEWGSDMFFSHGTSDSRGVAILFPANLDVTVTNEISDNDGRFLLLDIIIDETRLIFVNVYAPTKSHVVEQCQCLEELREVLMPLSGENLILGGDFNTVLNPLLDKKGGRREPVSN
jgi:endonuclease/exonuclease/phosphatase (EEP) superfamily protein YafD